MILSRWLPAVTIALLFLTAGCTRPPPPTLAPVGYYNRDDPSGGTPDSRQVRLTSVIWGPYHIRFVGTASLENSAHLQALLLKDGEPVDWWPHYLWLRIKDGGWEVGVNALDSETVPAELPRPEPGYLLRIFEPNYGFLSEDFDLGFSAQSLDNPLPGDGPPELDGTRWVLSSIDGHRPLIFTRFTLDFRGGSAGGAAGSNSYGGKYDTKAPNLIVFSSLVSTLVKSWWNAIDNQGRVYLNLLDNVAAYRVIGNRLELYDVLTNQRSLMFTRLGEATK
jgi:heat shock protein HslJ